MLFLKVERDLKLLSAQANVKPQNPKPDCGLDKVEDN
jgi:hypothetical protein